MPKSIHQSRAILEGVRRRVRKAEAEFYQKPGMTDRFRVKAAGFNCFDVVERKTGKVVTQTPCFGYSNAYRQTIELESKYAPLNIKFFGRALSNWALRISATLTVFAFFGSHL